jgi:hypothetical protein
MYASESPKESEMVFGVAIPEIWHGVCIATFAWLSDWTG